MLELTSEEGRIKINMKCIEAGEDLCVIITGGSKPHIGCVTLSTPRQSLKDKNAISSTTSILNMIGHKDDEVAKYISDKISSKLNRNVVVVCGIHLDNITAKEIEITLSLVEVLGDKLIENINS